METEELILPRTRTNKSSENRNSSLRYNPKYDPRNNFQNELKNNIPKQYGNTYEKAPLNNFENILENVKTKEGNNVEEKKDYFDNKIFIIALICIIGIIMVVIWFMWKNNEEEKLQSQQYPPGVYQNNIPPEYMANYLHQQRIAQMRNQNFASGNNMQQPLPNQIPSNDKDDESMRNMVKKKIKKKKIGPVPGEQLDNPQLYNKHVEFNNNVDIIKDNQLEKNDNKISDKNLLNESQKPNPDKTANKEEIDRQNVMDFASIMDS